MIKSHLLYQLSYAATLLDATVCQRTARADKLLGVVMVSAEGIEPSTYWLKASCSTD